MKLLFLSIFIFFAAVPSHALNTVKLVTAIIPPYQEFSIDNELGGLGVEIISCISKKMSLDIKIQVYSWKRAQFLVKDGMADGFFVASKNSTRDEYAIFSRPIIKSKWLWISKKNNKEILNNKTTRVGTIVGTSMANFQTKNFKNITFSIDMDRLFLLIQKNRVDKIMCTPDMLTEAMKRLKLNASDFSVEVAKDRPLGVYFGKSFIKKHPNFLKEFNNAVLSCSTYN